MLDVYKQTKLAISTIIPFQNFTSVNHRLPLKLFLGNLKTTTFPKTEKGQ